MKVIDITGRRFGRLVALSLVRRRRGKRVSVYWRCRCDCGKTKTISGDSLRLGNTLSCGCLRNERTRAACCTHGYTGTTTYNIWINMIQRCADQTHKQWNDYGGRGIKVCRRWHKFENFLSDMGPRPLGLFLDRKDNDKGYWKHNCRWVTPKTSANNRRLARSYYRRKPGRSELIFVRAMEGAE
jgi:hypothetical protein